MGWKRGLCFAAPVVWQLAGCLDPHVTNCPGGVVCPASQVCGPTGGCVDPEQLSACNGLADGTPCVTSRGGGLCAGTVCIAARCGDGVVNPGEACDDPNPEV